MKRLMPVRLLLLCVAICLVTAAGYADLDYHQSLISPYYRITRSTDAEIGDSWAVISHDGDVLAEGTASPYHDVPRLICIEGDILCLRDGSGTAFWFTFYDVARGRVSESYEYVIDLRGEDVLYSDRIDDEWRIVLSNVFSGETIHSIPMDLYSADGWVWDTKWDEASEAWIITYLAGEEFEETTVLFPADGNPALYPIRESGLWGYMNRAGDVVIEPQWATVWPFDGDTALVSTVDVSPYNYPICGDGVIDRDGQYVIAPQEHVTIEDYLTVYGVSYYDSITKESYEGFYDKVSGFYQPPIPEYNFVMLWGDDGIGPIAIENADGLTGYVDRITGETVIPFIYTGESDDVCFYEGYARPADDITIVDANGVEMMRGEQKHLIDTVGNEIALPEGMIAVSPVISGCVVFIMAVPDTEENVTAEDESSEDSTEEEEWYLSDGTKIEFPFYSLDRITGEKTEVDWHQYFDEDESAFGYGLARIDGSILYGPDPDISYMWEPDGDGMICFESWDDLWGHMDTSGNIMVTPRYHLPSGDERPRYTFSHGYAVFEDFGEKWPATSRWVILSAAGVEVFSQYRQSEGGSTFRICGDVLENGLVWYETSDGYGLMRITDEGAEDLSGPVFERSLGCGLYEDNTECRFSEGLHPVKQNGLWGYINEQVEWVITSQYESADNFRDGLALVEKNGKLMYIDHSGVVVWEEW